MRIRLRHLWDLLTSGYWFVPAAMAALAAALAFALLWVDRALIGAQGRSGWLYSGGPDGARTVLATVAGSVVTVAGVVFSITINALSQASSQFGPRLLRNFMRDTGNQVVLGTFVATFLYCLLVLRTIHARDEDTASLDFVPQASVTTGVAMAAASVAVLIYFIHHVSISLQAPMVVAAVLTELDQVAGRLRQHQEGAADSTRASPGPSPGAGKAWGEVIALVEGYVQAVDYDELIAAAEQEDLLLCLQYRPGDFVIAGSRLLRVQPADRTGPAVVARFNRAFICGRYATPEQDVEHAIRQIAEVAVRALSPGVNDPFTAMNCVDVLGGALCRIARSGLPGPLRYGCEGRLRLITRVTTFPGLTDASFNLIRQSAAGNVAVSIRLLETLAACIGQMDADEHRKSLLRHAGMVWRQAQATVSETEDLADLRRRFELAQAAAPARTP